MSRGESTGDGPGLPPRIRPAVPGDREFIVAELMANWGGVEISSLGRWYDADRLPALIAEVDGAPAGLLTYHIDEHRCEVITLSSRVERRGVGGALLAAAPGIARRNGCPRLLLTTTNDNLHALGFYQRRGWRLVAVHRDAMDAVRAVKPGVPLVGLAGIPLRDEIELEYPL